MRLIERTEAFQILQHVELRLRAALLDIVINGSVGVVGAGVNRFAEPVRRFERKPSPVRSHKRDACRVEIRVRPV